jgi:phage shock protein PspC (stress-responsive transcriptional regulator)
MMDKTIKINLAGILFQIDEPAYKVLRDYLQAINSRFRNAPGGNETIDDIEARIAEIFQARQGLAGVISKENVEAMIGIIGKPEEFEHFENTIETPLHTSQRRRLYRNPDDKIFSGVASGLGAYLNIDPVWIRLLFILFTIFYGVGFFVYIALWIALPAAHSDARKRELYGDVYHSAMNRKRQEKESFADSVSARNNDNERVSRLGNAFNEVFRALGKTIFIFVRIILIILGISFVLVGFISILSIIMIFFFKYPWIITSNGIGNEISYLPDFLNYVVHPTLTPWILILTSIVVVLPLLALIYWGIKMIFWFRARDGVVSLIGLVLWVLGAAALTIILFNEGFSFAETGRTSSQIMLKNAPDTLYVTVDKKVKDLSFNKELNLPWEEYSLFIIDSRNELAIRPSLRIFLSEDKSARVEVHKRSGGRNKMEAARKAEALMYDFSLRNDTLLLDEYFSVPSGNKWAGDNIHVDLYIPDGKIIHFDKTSENLFQSVYSRNSGSRNEINPLDLGNKYWIMSEDGLEEAYPKLRK